MKTEVSDRGESVCVGGGGVGGGGGGGSRLVSLCQYNVTG